jgi:UDP-N-acetyl-D-glucosamine dehydrogenase
MNPVKRVSIVGQGYVGLPLAMAAIRSGWHVTGIDVSLRIVDGLNSGVSHVEDVTNEDLQKAINAGLYKATNDGGVAADSEICIICVPTPLDANGLPDLSYLDSAVRLVAKLLPENALLVSESTSYPGTVRDFVAPLVASLRSDEAKGMSFASAPERVDPRNEKWKMENTPRLVSGIDSVSTERALAFYRSICETVIEVSKPEVAEMAKLLENTFRQVNIALINQLVPFCNQIGIDIREVVEAAGSKPYGYMKFFPGAGVGGHCIPIDPLFLLWKAHQVGVELPLIAKADEVNREMPIFVAKRMIELSRPMRGDCFLLLGVSYKRGVSDIRESPAKQIAEWLELNGYRVTWSDPLVSDFYHYAKFSNQKIEGVIVVTPQLGLEIEPFTSLEIPILDCTGEFKHFSNVSSL